MEPLFTDPEQGPRFTLRIIEFMTDWHPVLSILHNLLSGHPFQFQLRKVPLQSLRSWLSEGNLSDLDAFFIALDVALAGQNQAEQEKALMQIRRTLEQKVLETKDLPLLLRLQTEPRNVRLFLQAFLRQGTSDTGQKSRVPQALFLALSDPEPDVVVNLSKQLGDPATLLESLPILRATLTSREDAVRMMTVKLLGKLTDPAVLELLVSASKDSVPNIRREALRALERHHRALGTPTFIQALEDREDSIQAEAAKIMGRSQDLQFIPYLVKAAGDLDSKVSEAAIEGLIKLQPVLKDFEPGFVRTALTFTTHADWAGAPPSREELEEFRSRVLLLPPVGGKIPELLDSQGRLKGHRVFGALYRIDPAWTVEEQIQTVLQARQKGLLGDGYVHQLSVQGRLPDEFKYAAVALILSSPYRQDWKEPFFEADWGKVAPLVHDGGNVTVGLNPVWSNVQGRTDFLQRVVKVYDPARQPEHERMETDRLLLEARAYQRLALALHAARGTAPKAEEIPDGLSVQLREKLAERWHKFERDLLGLFEAYSGEIGGEKFDLTGPVRVKWFLDQPRRVKDWPGPRHEADWPPIREQLLMLNRFAEKTEPARKEEGADLSAYDALRLQVSALLKIVADDIDRDLGLLPRVEPPAPAAGLEEKRLDLDQFKATVNALGRAIAHLPSPNARSHILFRLYEILHQLGLTRNPPDRPHRLNIEYLGHFLRSWIGMAPRPAPFRLRVEDPDRFKTLLDDLMGQIVELDLRLILAWPEERHPLIASLRKGIPIQGMHRFMGFFLEQLSLRVPATELEEAYLAHWLAQLKHWAQRVRSEELASGEAQRHWVQQFLERGVAVISPPTFDELAQAIVKSEEWEVSFSLFSAPEGPFLVVQKQKKRSGLALAFGSTVLGHSHPRWANFPGLEASRGDTRSAKVRARLAPPMRMLIVGQVRREWELLLFNPKAEQWDLYPGTPEVQKVLQELGVIRPAAGGSTGLTTGLEERQPARTIPAFTEKAFSLAFTPDGRHLASAGSDGAIKFWKMEAGMEEAEALVAEFSWRIDLAFQFIENGHWVLLERMLTEIES